MYFTLPIDKKPLSLGFHTLQIYPFYKTPMNKQIKIKVVPNSKVQRVLEENDILKVYVNAPSIENKANEAVIKVIAQYFNLKKNALTIVAGFKSRNKTIQVNS